MEGIKSKSLIRRTAIEAKQYSIRMRMAKSLLVALIVLATIIYIVSALYMKTGSFTVVINKFEAQKYSLSLFEKKYDSDTYNYAAGTSNLNAYISQHMTNISGDSLPKDIDAIDGQHNGDNYIAYSFYIANCGEMDVTFQYSIVIKNISNNLDTAIRIRLYEDGVPTTYARTRTDGTGPESDTTEFITETIVMTNRVDGFEPQTSHRYTVVVWIEGDDPDCTDSLIGGSLKINMNFEIVY